MNTGYRFIEQLDLGTFVLGSIGSPSLAEGVESAFDLLGSPLFEFDMGQISGFQTNTDLISRSKAV